MNAPAMRAPLAQEAIRLPQPNEPAPCALAVAPADATPA